MTPPIDASDVRELENLVKAGGPDTDGGLSDRHDDALSEVEELLVRMRAGDRHAAADFVTRYGTRIRRRIRGKLGPDMRRLFDSQEILSTLGRRLDVYVRAGKLAAASEPQLWSLIFSMAEHALVDKARIWRRLQAVEGEDGPFAAALLARLDEADRTRACGAEVELDRALRSLDDATDRQILSLWLMGTPHNITAEVVGLAPTAVRKRWQNLKARLRDQIESESL